MKKLVIFIVCCLGTIVATTGCTATQLDDVKVAPTSTTSSSESDSDALADDESSMPDASVLSEIEHVDSAETEVAPIYEAGTYIVGTDFEVGIYRVEDYWAILDEDQGILNNDFTLNGLSLLIVTDDVAFVELGGSAIRVEDMPVVDPVFNNFVGGVYLVGVDISPGTYRITNDMAYAARLDDTLTIIDNAFQENSVILTIKETDYAFTFQGQIELIE